MINKITDWRKKHRLYPELWMILIILVGLFCWKDGSGDRWEIWRMAGDTLLISLSIYGNWETGLQMKRNEGWMRALFLSLFNEGESVDLALWNSLWNAERKVSKIGRMVYVVVMKCQSKMPKGQSKTKQPSFSLALSKSIAQLFPDSCIKKPSNIMHRFWPSVTCVWILDPRFWDLEWVTYPFCVFNVTTGLLKPVSQILSNIEMKRENIRKYLWILPSTS